MTDNTLLVLQAIGIPAYSARGLKQTLEPIPAATQNRRTVNGELVDFGYAQFRKYRSTITGTDVDPPAVDLVFPGTILTVSCIPELAYLSGGPGRPPVAGSVRTDADGFTYYRPQLTTRVVSWKLDRDEWGATLSWQLDLEEI